MQRNSPAAAACCGYEYTKMHKAAGRLSGSPAVAHDGSLCWAPSHVRHPVHNEQIPVTEPLKLVYYIVTCPSCQDFLDKNRMLRYIQ